MQWVDDQSSHPHYFPTIQTGPDFKYVDKKERVQGFGQMKKKKLEVGYIPLFLSLREKEDKRITYHEIERRHIRPGF